MIGAPSGRKSYVIFGKATGFADIDLLNLTSTQGFRLLGDQTYGNSGTSVASAGDVNGDGYSDIVIGDYLVYANSGTSAGTSYVIFGKATGFADIDLLSITNTKGFKIFGAAQYDYCGHSVASAGDVNGDGL